MSDKDKTMEHADTEPAKEMSHTASVHQEIQTKEQIVINLRGEGGNEPMEETPAESSRSQNLRPTFVFTPLGVMASATTIVILVVLVWIVVWSVIGSEMLPGGQQFGIIILYFCAFIGGELFRHIKLPKLPPLPPIVGMLLAGFLIRNIPVISENVQIYCSSFLRNVALFFSLVSAAFEVDLKALMELKGVFVRLSIVPYLVEMCISAVLAHFLMGLPWQWGLMLGFVLGAVSPAVAVPSVHHLQIKGYCVDKRVPTLLMAAGILDDFLAITGFSVCLMIAFPTGFETYALGECWQVLTGLINGSLLLHIILPVRRRYQSNRMWNGGLAVLKGVFTALVCLAPVVTFYYSVVSDSPASGAVLCTCFVAFVVGLRRTKEKAEVKKIIRVACHVSQPLLFGLFGAEVPVASLRSETIGLCVAILGLAVLTRILTTFLMVHFSGFNMKEKVFISFAWLSKATVQATLGPVALETARLYGALDLEEYGMNVLTVAFLAILFTALVRPLLIGLVGLSPLQKPEEHQNKNEEVQEGSSEQLQR